MDRVFLLLLHFPPFWIECPRQKDLSKCGKSVNYNSDVSNNGTQDFHILNKVSAHAEYFIPL